MANDIISDDAWLYFIDRWLHPSRPTTALVYRMMILENKTYKHDWKIPSLSTMYRLIENRISKKTQKYFRKGIYS